MNALDEAITKGKKLPIKGRKKLPADYDVMVPAMKKPTKKINKKLVKVLTSKEVIAKVARLQIRYA